MHEEILLEIKNVSKSFGVTQALSDVSLKVRAGTIHSLLGRNGAGKSTLVNIIAGLYPQSQGSVLFEGKDIRGLNIFQRQNLGIKIVPQHESIIPYMSIAENIFLGVLPTRKNGFVDWKKINRIAAEELKRYGLDVDPKMQARKLNSVDTRKLNIIRAMHGGAKLIILDEPTTALSNVERDALFAFIRELKDKGTAFIFISHYLNEVIELSDDITVVRDGRAYNGMENGKKVNIQELSTLIAGEDVVPVRRKLRYDYEEKDRLLECKNISGACMENISFELYKGQVLGVIGFQGSGAREVCRALYGLNKITGGEVWLQGEKVDILSPQDALKRGIAYISYDRHREGLIPQFTINQNIGAMLMNGRLKRKTGLLDKRGERKISEEYSGQMKIKCNSIDDAIRSLSGGNQQKVVVSKFLSTQPRLLILDEPTIGIDIKSREEIIGTVDGMTREGVAVMYLTNDFEELLRVADKLIFFKDSKVVAYVDNNRIDIDEVTRLRDNTAGKR